MATVYFDNSATTAVDPRVMEEMMPYFSAKYGNASSLHSFGREAYNALEKARERCAKAIGAQPREIIFTSGGTEADNLAIQGIAFSSKEKGDHIITCAIEHHAVLHTCQFLESQGFKVTYLPVDREGRVSFEDVKNAITKKTVLVSIMAANNEIGTIEPIREIGAVAHEAGVAFHTDAVQAITKVPIDVVHDNIDLLALSGHKFHGPKGVGLLYVKKGVKLRPMIYGGGHERGLRSSTENVAGLVGMGKAIELGIAEMPEAVPKMTMIRDRIIDGVLEAIPDTYLNGPREGRLCNNAHFRFDFIEGESLILQLDAEGFAGSTGSACSTKTLDPSHVLMAIGLRPEQAHGSLRISLSKMNTLEEAEAFLKIVPRIVGKLREMSPIKSWKDYEGFETKECEH
ncbi:MAG TPA: cysteine desulfurase NifS [Methanomassiliicoccales archaeon]|nr:cysteine desulfurase NifS [Methanomassiliicoccales archaeon]